MNMKPITDITRALAAPLTALSLVLPTAAPAAATATGGDAFQPVFVDSLKACASNKGKTARKAYTISAGPDRVFIPETIRFAVDSATGHKTGIWFHEHRYEMKPVKMTVDGRTYTIKMPSKIVVEPFAETGSGHAFDVCAWNNGYIHAETMEIER